MEIKIMITKSRIITFILSALLFSQFLGSNYLNGQSNESKFNTDDLKNKIDYIVKNRFKGRGELVRELPIESVDFLIKALNSDSEDTQNIRYYSLLASKFQQFEPEVKEPILSQVIDTLISKKMDFDKSNHVIDSISYQESVLSYWTQIKHPRIKAAYQEWRLKLDIVRAEVAAAERAKLGLTNLPKPTLIPTPHSTPTPTPPPSNLSKPTPAPSQIPTPVSPATYSDTSSFPAWTWVAAILACFTLTLIGWLIKRLNKH